MSDIATVILENKTSLYCDWVMDGPDIESDDGMLTAVTISLLTDRLADADDDIPDAPGIGQPGIADRRGWWGDTVPSSSTDKKPDLIGSRLWLLARASATPQTATLAKGYIQEALAWMIEDGVAGRVNVAARIDPQNSDALAVGIQIVRTAANGAPVNHAYDFVWASTNGVLGTPDTIVLHQVLGNEAGVLVVDQDSKPIDVN